MNDDLSASLNDKTIKSNSVQKPTERPYIGSWDKEDK